MKKLTDQLRKQLGKPFGEIIQGKDALEKVKARKGILASVGDACSMLFIQNSVKPEVVIYDLKIKRQPVDAATKAALEGFEGKCVRVVNEASTITPQLESAVKLALRGKAQKVFVDGEEDLATLIVMMHAEDGALIAYGQPDEGLVLLESSEKMRNKARTIYGKMIDV